jgi:TatD DNase family protein
VTSTKTLLFDTHTHLYDQRFDDDRGEVLQTCSDQLKGWVNVGSDLKSSKQSIQYARQFPSSFASSGIHPHDAASHSYAELADVVKLYQEKEVVAAGEMGLDFYYDNSPRQIQREIFKAQLQAAKAAQLPCIIHVRDAFDDFFELVDEVGYYRGVVHCFSGTPQLASQALDRGYYLGYGGIITFKTAQEIRDSLAITPLSRILIETDCPYLAPVPKRGKRNEPVFVQFVAEKIGEIKSETYENIVDLTYQNACDLFALPG